MTVPTFASIYAQGQAEAVARDPSLTDWNDGSVNDAVIGAGAVLADQSIRIGLDGFKARFIATATGDDLDAAVVDRYPELTRNLASGAVGTLTFDRGTNTGAINIPAALTVRATVNGTTYSFTTDAATVIDAAADTVDVNATCTVTGTGGNVAAGTVTTIAGTIADDLTGDVTVTNADRFVGGSDDESDDDYRARAQAYPSTLSDGTVSALELAAVGVPGVSYATVDEGTVGIVYVYVSDADGNGNAALADAAQTAVDAVRSAGVIVECVAAAREEVDLSLTVYVVAGAGTAALKAAISLAVLRYTGNIAPGESLYLSAAEAAAIGVSSVVRGAVASSTSAVGETVTPTVAENALRVVSPVITFTEV